MDEKLVTFEQADRDLFEKVRSATQELCTERYSSKELTEQVNDTALIVENEISLRGESIATALLYRYVQYEQLSIDEVRETFGDSIADLIQNVLRIALLKKESLSFQTDSFIQLVLTISPDPRAILILLAEQLNKMRNFPSLPEHYHEQVLLEIRNLYAPIAHRLGLYTIKTELEEQWMKRAHYPIFRDIADKLDGKKGEREEFITSFIAPLKSKMVEDSIECEIKGRPKSIYSIWNKMKVQGVDVDGVYDKFAIRIIIESDSLEKEKELCWRAYSIVTEKYTPFPKRLRDWISNPKSSGYESLHTTVQTSNGDWVEIQIRTRRMDEIAEKGHAAHWRYKESSTGAKSDWLSEMRNALEQRSEPGGENKLKQALYGGNIFVFTPNEEIKQLRAGATLLDFAFTVHSNVGLTCTGGTVNGKHANIRHKLQNGDIVSVTTSKRQQPNEEWLTLVKSSRARSKIKQALKRKENKFADIGKELVKRKLELLKIEHNAESLLILNEFFGVEDTTTLYEKIGDQTFDIHRVKKAFVTPKPEEPEQVLEPIDEETPVVVTADSSDSLVIDENISGVQYSLATCCRPVRGDAIFGFVSVNKGIRVHRVNCPNARDLFKNQNHRIVTAQWTRGKQGQQFHCTLQVKYFDDQQVLGNITSAVRNSAGVSLQGMTVTPEPTLCFASLSLLVDSNESRDSLAQKIRELQNIESVF